MMESENEGFLARYGKALAAAGSAGVAGFAAIDQALQGETQMIETLAANEELIDQAGHQAIGVLGGIALEYGYSRFKKEDSEEGFGKYAVMLTGAYAAGGLGQASQYVISGTPELLAATESITGGLYATVGQIGADSYRSRNDSDRKPKQ